MPERLSLEKDDCAVEGEVNWEFKIGENATGPGRKMYKVIAPRDVIRRYISRRDLFGTTPWPIVGTV